LTRWLAGCTVWLAAACAASGGSLALEADSGAPDAAVLAEPVELVDLGDFTEMDEAADPFAAMAPGHLPCTPPAFVLEQDPAGSSTLEVRTDVCNFLTLQQPARVPIRRGDTLRLLLWHNTLASLESAQAYAAVSIAGAIVWSVDVAIPSAAVSYTPTWRASKNIPEGSLVLLHIHNHGANAWRFGELTVQAAREHYR
jgi:hypothetical protein